MNEQGEILKNTTKNRGLLLHHRDYTLCVPIAWGPFLVIKEEKTQEFTNQFFDGIDVNTLHIEGKFSPKIFIVKPEARLSW